MSYHRERTPGAWVLGATISADELNALADFYGSSVGASAMKKFGAYMADVAPALQLELRRGMQELGKNKAK